ncbi:hypothetical protein [Botrimarina mediterranea]|uniref:hypothetical protein n=1 Tax=Botrimarina mediterranea TaxID=2528022 RepID=UPI0011A17517
MVHYDDLAASCLTIHQRGVELHFTDYSIELTGIECPRFLPLLSNRLIRTLDIPPNDYLDTLPPGDYFCHYCGSIRDEQDELTRRARLELPGRPQH